MKKVKIKLSWDQLDTLDKSMALAIPVLSDNPIFGDKLVAAVLAQWREKLAKKLVHINPKPISLTLDAPVAMALMCYGSFMHDPKRSPTYLDAILINISHEINKQLC